VELDEERGAVVTIGAKDAFAHLLFAVIGPGDVVVSPNRCCPIYRYGVVMAEGRAEMVAKGLCRDPGRRKLKHAARSTV
jgi:aspartate/methionine/tyrosine aminotransferase